MEECVFWVSSGWDDAGLVPPCPPVGSCYYSTYAREVYFGECPDGAGIVSGFRFPNVNLPQGAQIAEAYLEFTVGGPYTDDLTVVFYGEDNGNAPPFSMSNPPQDRPLTQASVTWHIPADDRWELGQIRTSPDLSAIIQEIVSRPDWTPGNALAIIVQNAGPASGPWRHRRVIGYERPVWYPGPENAARLVIRLARPVTVTFVDTEGHPVTAQSLNTDGWPVPNPVLARVTLQCLEVAGCDFYAFRLHLSSADGQGRFYVYRNPLGGDGCTTTITGDEHSQRALEVFCPRLSLMYQEKATYTWGIWVQPSEATQMVAEARYEPTAEDTARVSVPQAAIYPVVVIPGIMGSWLDDTGEWVLDPLLGTYNNLLEELRRTGYEDGISLFPFPYDWRRSNTYTGNLLGQAISSFLSRAAARPYVRTDRVDIVAHSMGGLVSRAYIQSDGYAGNVRRLITLGTPHLGAPAAYRAAEGAEFNFPLNVVVRYLAEKQGYCTWIPGPPGRERCLVLPEDLYWFVYHEVPSLRELLPDRRYLEDDPGGYLVHKDTGEVYPYGWPPNGFLTLLNDNIGVLVTRLGVENIVPVVGVGQGDTEIRYFVVKPEPGDAPLWTYGKVVRVIRGEGDGTVPAASAQLDRFGIPSLVRQRADDGIQQIEHRHMPTQLQQTVMEKFVGLRPPFDAGFYDPLFENVLLIRNLSPVEIQVIDPLGRRMGVDFDTGGTLAEIPNAHFWRSDAPDEPDFIFIGDPLPGPYTIRLLGIADGIYRVGMDVFNEQGLVVVDEVRGESEPGGMYEHVLVYDPNTLPALPLRLTWLPPLHEEEAVVVAAQRTLSVKFRIHDAQGHFAVDDEVMVLLVDPEQPDEALAVFTAQGPPGERIRILERAAMYRLPLHLNRYPLETGRVYRIVVYAFGQPLGTAVFQVRR